MEFNEITNIFFTFCFFLIGISLGSFLNVLIYRIHNNMDWFKKRSFCPMCKKKLIWHDIIPLFSFLFLKGKCRYCKRKIPISYFLVELFSGIIFAFSYSFFLGNFWLFLIISFSLLLFLGLFVSDFKYLEFPSIFLYGLIFLGITYNATISFNNNIFNILEFFLTKEFWFSILIPFFFFGIQYIITGGKGLGDGDIWLGVGIGLFLGFPLIIYSILFSYCIASVIFLPLLLLKKVNRKTPIPLGVFLIPVAVVLFILKTFFNINFSYNGLFLLIF